MKYFAIMALAALLSLQATASSALEPGKPATCSGPIKKILLIKRKAGTTPEQFRQHYETIHVPLALKLLGDLALDYRRNYVQPADPAAPPRPGIDHDVVTELWFKDKAMMDAFYARVRQPEIYAQIAADEATFMDRPANRQITVDECQSPG